MTPQSVDDCKVALNSPPWDYVLREQASESRKNCCILFYSIFIK
uniref:Uncharacterized protein n=1 Tax=Anguilla anguilla TaxID=7936 RepID=A0A0E9VXR7_ANGAN